MLKLSERTNASDGRSGTSSRKLARTRRSLSGALLHGSERRWNSPFPQAVASGDAFEHRPSECGHCVQDFLAELDLRDLPGEAAGSESGADDVLPTVGSGAECGRITAYFGGCMTTSRVTLLHREKNTDGQERR